MLGILVSLKKLLNQRGKKYVRQAQTVIPLT